MILKPNFIKISNFLTNDEIMELFNIIEENKENFQDTTTSTDAEDYRKSKILFTKYYEELYFKWKSKLFNMLSDLCDELCHPHFVPEMFELQIIATNDGGFYKLHSDSGHDTCKDREITFVYYFNREPKKFSGGQLQIYKTDTSSLQVDEVNSIKIDPEHNSIIFFDSKLLHQVLNTKVPSKNFMDSRFTLTGWFRS
jgi:Rps23 Pro-64 3,4-dihydroxylase Tpa1-like proline 4-hydroxylase